MSEKTRLLIHTGGVVVVFTIIIIIRFLSYLPNGIKDFLVYEFVIYMLGITFILIFTQFLIGTTYSSTPKNSTKNDPKILEKQKRLQQEIERVNATYLKEKKTSKLLESKNHELEKKYNALENSLREFEQQIQKSIISDKSLISPDLALIYPQLHVKENNFFSIYNNLNQLVSKGIDSYQLESSVAYMGSYQIYDLLSFALNETNEFEVKQIDEMLIEYASTLNESLSYVEVINYGYKNIYEPSSHLPIGFIDEHDQVTPKSFKVTSRDTGSIIYKALVRRV